MNPITSYCTTHAEDLSEQAFAGVARADDQETVSRRRPSVVRKFLMVEPDEHSQSRPAEEWSRTDRP